MRIAEIDVDPTLDRELRVLGHFFTLVPGDTLPQELGECDHLPSQEPGYPISITIVGNAYQHHEAGGTLDQCRDLRFVSLADNKVTFPEAGHGPIVGLRRPFADVDHVPNGAPGYSGP